MSERNTNVAGSGISLGLTLYSLTNEWWSRSFDLEGLIGEVSARGLGPGVEMVGFQSIRSFPDVDEAFVDDWHRIVATYGIVPTCLASNIDVALRPDRPLTEDEMVAYLDRQLLSAARLGFPIVRTQIGAPPKVLERCLPTAEKYGITMGMEVHAPEGFRTPTIQRVAEFYDRIDSPLLGFIPDFSATMRAIPPGELDELLSAGLPREQVAALVEAWLGEGAPFERFGRFAAAAEAAGVDPHTVGSAVMAFTMHGREPIDSWADYAQRIVHVHGKCYEFTDAGDEPSIDYPAIGRVLLDAGYRGWISTEWEGHAYKAPGEADGFAMVASQQALLRRSLTAASP